METARSLPRISSANYESTVLDMDVAIIQKRREADMTVKFRAQYREVEDTLHPVILNMALRARRARNIYDLRNETRSIQKRCIQLILFNPESPTISQARHELQIDMQVTVELCKDFLAWE
jgi:hypothetical protein